MALTDFEKTYLCNCQRMLQNGGGQRRRGGMQGPASAEDKADLDTLATGTEEERRALIVAHITNKALPTITAELVKAETKKTTLEARQTELNDYLA